MRDAKPSLGTSTPSGLIKLLFLALFLLNLAIVSFSAFSLYQSRQHSAQLTAADARNLAQILEYSLSGLIDRTDMVLQIAAEQIERQIVLNATDLKLIAGLLNTEKQRLPDVDKLGFIDEHGDLSCASDFSLLPETNYAGPEFYRSLRDATQTGLFIAKPVFEKTSKQWLIVFARQIRHPEQSFAGAVFAEIRLRHLEHVLSPLEARPSTTISLLDQDFALIGGYPTEELTDENIGSRTLSASFAHALQADPGKGIYRNADGSPHIHAYLKFDRYPFYIDVGLSEDDYLRSWHKEVRIAATLITIFLVTSSVCSWLLIRTLRRLQSDSEKLRGLFELSPLGIALNDLNGRYVEFNDAFRRICGYSAEELRNLDYWALTPKKYQTEEAAQLQEIGSTGHYGPYEKEYLRKDGSLVPLCLNGMLVKGSDNQQYIWSIVEDISARKHAEEEMKIAALVYQASNEGMMVLDADNNIISINPAFTAITGYSAAEAIGKNPKILIPDKQNNSNYEAVWQALETTGNWQGELWSRHKNGETYVQWLSINSIYHDNGSLHRRVGMFSDITEKKQHDDLIWRQANYDVLTDLPNRQMVRNRLKEEIKKSLRTRKPIALLFIDLDRFKEVNDALGHDIGDFLLIDAAGRMLSCVRETDTVGRLGGDEFMIILNELDEIDCIERIARKLLDSLAAPYRLNDELAYISASIGITVYPQDAADLPALLRNADQAMYAAKRQGRNCFHYYTPALQDRANARVRLSNDLHQALADNQLKVHYQAIVDLATGDIRKAEALIRWLHPKHGLISPAEFIPIAEDTGQIIEIGDWVYLQAANQAAHWRDTYHPNFQISVNKSPVQFKGAGSQHLAWFAHLARLGLPGDAIVIEITEGLLMEAGENISNQLLKFRDNGTQVALDDFGTGYSSLSYLKKFDIDYLKIDQSFVRNLSPESSDMVLCEAMIVMAHKLGIKVIAEGVETQAQCDLLKQIGCDFGQGYLFAKPMPAEEFEKLLARSDHRAEPA